MKATNRKVKGNRVIYGLAFHVMECNFAFILTDK